MKISDISRRMAGLLLSLCLCLPVSAADSGTMLQPATARLPVLMYHSLYAGGGDMWVIPPAEFEQDLRYLRENGYESVGVADLTAFVYDGVPLPEKPIMLTFDDGYYNNLTQALPLLEKYDMKMVLSVIGSYTDMWSSNGELLSEDYSHLSWKQLNTLLESGRVELSNHTQNMHRSFEGRSGCIRKSGENLQSYRELLDEDVGALQKNIRNNCGVTPICFAYPFGNKCPDSLAALQEMGFLVTLSCYSGMNHLTQGDPSCLYDMHRNNRVPYTPAQSILEQMAEPE